MRRVGNDEMYFAYLKMHKSAGIEIKRLGCGSTAALTQEELKKDNVTIFKTKIKYKFLSHQETF